jgi:hypothetical protein
MSRSIVADYVRGRERILGVGRERHLARKLVEILGRDLAVELVHDEADDLERWVP